MVFDVALGIIVAWFILGITPAVFGLLGTILVAIIAMMFGDK